MLEVREVLSIDQEPWLELWHGYLEFYETSLDRAITDGLWKRLLDPRRPELGLVAVSDDRLIGFANLIPHPVTWSLADAGYLEDLFVKAEARGRGVGHRLIESVLAIGRDRCWSRIYWHTHRENRAARVLYDRFIPADHMVRYRVVL